MRYDANAIYTMAQIQRKQQTCRKGPVRVFSALVMHIAAPFRYLARSLKVNGKKKKHQLEQDQNFGDWTAATLDAKKKIVGTR